MAKKRVANKKEKEHLAKVASLGCYVCERPAEVHHIRPKGLGISLKFYATNLAKGADKS